MACIAPKSLEESGRVEERYSRQDGQLNEDRLTENSVSLNDVWKWEVKILFILGPKKKMEQTKRRTPHHYTMLTTERGQHNSNMIFENYLVVLLPRSSVRTAYDRQTIWGGTTASDTIASCLPPLGDDGASSLGWWRRGVRLHLDVVSYVGRRPAYRVVDVFRLHPLQRVARLFATLAAATCHWHHHHRCYHCHHHHRRHHYHHVRRFHVSVTLVALLLLTLSV